MSHQNQCFSWESIEGKEESVKPSDNVVTLEKLLEEDGASMEPSEDNDALEEPNEEEKAIHKLSEDKVALVQRYDCKLWLVIYM